MNKEDEKRVREIVKEELRQVARKEMLNRLAFVSAAMSFLLVIFANEIIAGFSAIPTDMAKSFVAFDQALFSFIGVLAVIVWIGAITPEDFA